MLGIGNDLVNQIQLFVGEKLERHKSTAIWRAVCDVLYNHKVQFQRYYTATLVGNDIRRLLDNYEAICTDIEAVLHDAQFRKDDADVDIDATITQFMSNMKKIMQVFAAACSLMAHVNKLTPEQIVQFRVLCTTTGAMWRAYFPNAGVTPKMHLLESHAPLQMELFGCLGDKSEAGVERLHKVTNQYMRALAALSSYEKKKSVQVRRECQAELVEVVAAGKRAWDGTRRSLSQAAIAQREANSLTIVANKDNTIANAVHTANEFIGN